MALPRMIAEPFHHSMFISTGVGQGSPDAPLSGSHAERGNQKVKYGRSCVEKHGNTVAGDRGPKVKLEGQRITNHPPADPTLFAFLFLTTT